METACLKYGCRIHSYCLMNNHYHLLIHTKSPNLPQVMHAINMNYALYFNKRHSEVGYVFQGRYQDKIVEDDEYYKKLIAYIHLNPVEAGLAKKPEDWRWSSIHTLLDKEEPPGYQEMHYPRRVLELKVNKFLDQEAQHLGQFQLASGKVYLLLNEFERQTIQFYQSSKNYDAIDFKQFVQYLKSEKSFTYPEIGSMFGIHGDILKNFTRYV